MASLTEMLDVPDSGGYASVRAVVAAIESVMTFPAMPAIAIRVVPAVHGGGEGAYVRHRGGSPLRIEIAQQAEHPELTTAHELAHYLDDCGFGTSEGWASEAEPRLEALRQAWGNTDAVRALRTGLETRQLTASLPNGAQVEFPLMPEERENCRYYLQGQELFARSYAQYLADKSKNRVLLHQVRQRRESVEGRFYHVQWATSGQSPKRSIRFWRNTDGCDKCRPGGRCFWSERVRH